ncbi:MAG: substrate-binding domain-containing protein [Synergistaceae bacterium]|nr:substrate-binding domain-containing protein [Synergistaceae bacterium]
MTKKKIIALILALSLVLSSASSLFAAPIKIGISIWSSTDTLGSECKRMIDAAAKALGVQTQWVDQAHISEQVTASAETLALADCDGIIICNSASAEMGSVIKTCDENEVYVAQFFRAIDKDTNPEEYKQAVESKYYVGAVHESEFDNGKTLVLILAGQKGCRKIGLEGWEPGDATFLGRWAGYKAGVEAWNAEHPNDKVVLLDPQYGRTTTDTGRATAEAIIDANPDIDALIVAGGGGDTLLGAIAAIEAKDSPAKSLSFRPTSSPTLTLNSRAVLWRLSQADTTQTRSSRSLWFTTRFAASTRLRLTASMTWCSRTCMSLPLRTTRTTQSTSQATRFPTTRRKSKLSQNSAMKTSRRLAQNFRLKMSFQDTQSSFSS